MRIVGKINPDIFACISRDITTAVVIITDVQMKHIQDRHPGDFELFAHQIQTAVEAPDYILETSAYATAFVLKQ